MYPHLEVEANFLMDVRIRKTDSWLFKKADNSFGKLELIGVQNMKKLALMLSMIFLLGIMAAAIPVSGASVSTPLKAKHTLTGATLTAFDSDYDSRDFLIASGSQLDLDKVIVGLILPDEDVSVNLAETSLMSDASIDSESDFSRTFINSSYNDAVESTAADVAVDSQLSSSFADVRMDANVRFNTSSAETATWYSYLATDVNGDGDYEDSADEHYRTSIGGQGQILYFNMMADWNVSDADNYAKLIWSFETTGSADYDVEIVLYTGTGDSAWSNVDSAGEDKITLSLYDTDAEVIALGMEISELIQMDLGDNPPISGLDEIIVEVGTNNAAAEVDVRINNIAVFGDMPAATDRTDNDEDWELDGASGGLWTGLHDDNDFLITSVTEGASETYDYTVPLYNKIETSPYAMPQDAKIIQFTGNMYYLPQEWSVSSVAKGAFWETTELWTYDTTDIDDLKTPSNVITWGDTYYNMTLSQSVIYDDWEDFEDSLISFEMEGTDKTEEVRNLWDGATEDDFKIAYDGTNPDGTTGSSYDIKVVYNTDEKYDEEAGVAVIADRADNTLLFIGIGVIILLAGAALFMATRGGRETPAQRRRRKGR